MAKVMILGGSGMIGTGLAQSLQAASIEVEVTSRNGLPLERLPGVAVHKFEAKADSIESLVAELQAGDYVINCIGMVKSLINDHDPESCDAAHFLNSTFPSKLASVAESRGLRVIQMATDCVYSGQDGNYSETSAHDATDVYGQTKSRGEIPSTSVMNLRVSVIGKGSQGLYHWVASQLQGATIAGYVDHQWNGITSVEYGRIIAGIVRDDLFTPGVHHIVPTGSVNKNELVQLIAANAGRSDIKIVPANSSKAVDRTLTTNDEAFNAKLWAAAGRATVPRVAELVAEI
jgi:dTDP-4-dehydrorhamnose reductase